MKIIEAKLQLAVNANNFLGETPIWHPGERALYWVNCENRPELHRWNPVDGEHRVWPMPERIGGFVPKAGGGMLLALSSGLFDMDLETGELVKRVANPLPQHISLHECHCDRTGRFWVGSVNHESMRPHPLPGGGCFFRLDGDQLVPVLHGISCSNGLAFSPDGRTLYHSDSLTRVCCRWDVDPATGHVSNRREYFTLEPHEGVVDGATVDEEGAYWVSIMFGGALRRYLPDGTFDLEVKLPFSNPTKVGFGGPDLATLYITTSRMPLPGFPQLGRELLGGVYAFKPGVRGVEECSFRR